MEKLDLRATGRIWIELPEGRFVGSGKVELMEKIQKLGSIRQAAIEMKMSYRQAWGLIEEMNEMAKTPLVISQRGGKGGGKALVTEKGEKIIAVFRAFQSNFTSFLQEQSNFFKSFEKELIKNS